MANKTIQDKNLKVQDDVFQMLPKWCKIILKLKEEIVKENKPKDI